ncbi:MAG: hypothetical protein ACAH65_03005 [Chloroflexota bacterium]
MSSDSKGWTTGASIEELPTVRLPPAPLRGTRLGVGGALAVVGMVALLGAGFGVLGGRPGASASPVGGAVAPSQQPVTPQVAPTAPPSPRVTPYSECAAPTTEPVDVLLEVNGLPISGMFDSFGQFEPMPPVLDPAAVRESFGAPIAIPVDAITELWVVRGACAVAWNIGFVDGDMLDVYEPTPRDPAVGAQNRFGLTLAPYAGRDEVLRADLFFLTMSIRAAWPIHVETFDRPVAALEGGDGEAVVVEGCDVVVTLANGYQSQQPEGCDNDMPVQPGEFFVLDRTELVRFWLRDWQVTNGVLICGHLSDTAFVAEPEPGCFVDGSANNEDGSITFEVPPEVEGRWTIALAACAQSFGNVIANQICGTWYANVRFGP